MHWTTRTAILALALTACTGGGDEPEPTKNDTMGDGPHCEETSTDISLTEVTALGFAADDMVALSDGVHEETMTWAIGGTTPVTVTVTLGTTARFVDSEAVYPTTGTYSAIGVECEDRVEIDGTLELTTDDGLLAETVEGALASTDGLSAWLRADLDPDGLGGTLVMDDFISDLEDYDERSMWVNAEFDSEGSSGSVDGMISGTGDCEAGEECTAWAGSVSIGSWGPASY